MLEKSSGEKPEILADALYECTRCGTCTRNGIVVLPDPDLSELLSSGRLITEPIVMEQLDEGHCHENVAELWLSRERGLTAIGTGYALSEDGLWRQHSWGMRDDQIVERVRIVARNPQHRAGS